MRPGDGKLKVNGKELDSLLSYLNNNEIWVKHALEPLMVTNLLGKFDLVIRVNGGGLSGQSGALRLGIARAILEYDESLKPTLKEKDMLTRDSRKVERKKYGHRKSRKKAQFSKR